VSFDFCFEHLNSLPIRREFYFAAAQNSADGEQSAHLLCSIYHEQGILMCLTRESTHELVHVYKRSHKQVVVARPLWQTCLSSLKIKCMLNLDGNSRWGQRVDEILEKCEETAKKRESITDREERRCLCTNDVNVRDKMYY
jgi:hypothetical protein